MRSRVAVPIIAAAVLLVVSGCCYDGVDGVAGAHGVSGLRNAARPRLLFTADDIAGLRAKAGGGVAGDAFAAMKEGADHYLTLPTDPYQPDATTAMLRDGSSGRGIQMHVWELALTGWLTGDRRYTDKAIAIVESCWEHYPIEVYGNALSHLQVGDAAIGYAVAYDWLHPFLDDGQRERLRGQVEAYGSWLYEHSRYEQPVSQGDLYRPRLAHNHGAVVHGGLALCALTLGDRDDWLEYALRRCKLYLENAIDRTGCPYEGSMYFGYGSHGVVLAAAAYDRLYGRNIVDEVPRCRQIPRAVLHHLAPWGSELALINQTAHLMRPGTSMVYSMFRYRDAVGLWAWERMVGALGTGDHGMGGYQGCTTAPFVVLWADPQLQPLSPAAAGAPPQAFFELGESFLRTGWDDSDALVTFRSAEAIPGIWNHADQNSFMFLAYGEEFAAEIGPHYYTTEFHNTILVDGQGQAWEKPGNAVRGRTITHEVRARSVYVLGDAATAYQVSLGNWRQGVFVRRAFRHLLFVPEPRPMLLIMDDLEHLDRANHEWTWMMNSGNRIRPGRNTIKVMPDERRARITGVNCGATCDVHMLWPPDAAMSTTVKSRYRLPCLEARATAVNPRFVALLTASGPGAEPPTVFATGEAPDMTVTVRFDDGTERVLEVQPDNLLLGVR